MSRELITSTPVDAESDSVILYDIEDRLPLGEAAPLGIQRTLAMFLGNVASSLISTSTVGSVSDRTTFLVRMALIVVDMVTLMQAFPIGSVGTRLPIAMGTNFAFLGPLISIDRQLDIATVFGMSLFVAPVKLVMGVTFNRFQKCFPPLVTGIVVTLVGLTFTPTGMDYATGVSASPSAADYGLFVNPGLVGPVLVVTVAPNQFFDGFFRIISAFVGIVVGYVAVITLGMVDFTAIATAGWITVSTPLKFSPGFPPSTVLTVAFLYVITDLETVGGISGTVSAAGQNPTHKEFRSDLVADAVMSTLAVLLNALPDTSFSQNVGLVSFIGAASRCVVGTGGVVLVVLGFVPKVDAVVSAMPGTVLDGGALILSAMIFSSGVRIIVQNVTLDRRNSIVLTLSVVFGLGMALRPRVLQNLLIEVQTLFSSAPATGDFAALALNIMLPGGGVGLDPTEHTDGLNPEDLTELPSSESSPSAPADD